MEDESRIYWSTPISELMHADEDEDELYHYGVKGMKWGVRRYQDSSGRLTSAGKKHRKELQSKTANSDDIGNPAVLAILPILPHLTIATGIAVSRGAKWCQSKGYAKERTEAEVDPKTGLKVKSKDLTWKQDLKRVNPDYYTNKEEVTHNCMLCTSTYDLRRRGYDVTAARTESGFTTDQIKKWYPKAKIEKVTGRDEFGRYSAQRQTDKVIAALGKQGEGARGNIMVMWKGTGGGHSMAYEVRNGKVQIIDAQTGKVYDKPEKVLNYCLDGITYARLDNVAFDKKQIRGCIDD